MFFRNNLLFKSIKSLKVCFRPVALSLLLILLLLIVKPVGAFDGLSDSDIIANSASNNSLSCEDIVKMDIKAQNNNNASAYLSLRTPIEGMPENKSDIESYLNHSDDTLHIIQNTKSADLVDLKELPKSLARNITNTSYYESYYDELQVYYVSINYEFEVETSYLKNGLNYKLYIIGLINDQWEIVEFSAAPVFYINEAGWGFNTNEEFDLKQEQYSMYIQQDYNAPVSIRVWRRSLNRVDVIEFYDYQKGVLPNEWFGSWPYQSLYTGTVALKMFAWWHTIYPKYSSVNADVCDSAASQVYNPSNRYWKSDQAVEDMRGIGMVRNDGAFFQTEYIDGIAKVNTSTLRIRATPGTSGQEIGILSQGDLVVVLSNAMTYKDNYHWYYIYKYGSTQTVGWVAGELLVLNANNLSMMNYKDRLSAWGSKYWADQGKGYEWILKYFYDNTTRTGNQTVKMINYSGSGSTPPSTKFSTSDWVRTTNTTQNIAFRPSYGLNNTPYGYYPGNTIAQVQANSNNGIFADGHYWWYVKLYNENEERPGWFTESFLTITSPPVTSYTLTVNSTNPTSGVSITSSSGHGGTTSYSRSVAQGTNVSLTAPQYVGSGTSRKSFSSWSGAVSSTNRTISLTMNANRTVTANYVNDPEGTSGLVVQSLTVLPSTSQLGTELTATIVIKNTGSTNINTNFWTDFYENRSTSPGSIDGDEYWQTTSLAAGATRTFTYKFTPISTGTKSAWAQVDTDQQVSQNPHVLGPVNYYVTESSPTSYTLTVNSTNPTSGVSITSSSGHGGTTSYSRSVAQGTTVSLTAPQYVGSGSSRKSFSSWSGAVSSTNRTISLTMNANRTVSANYVNDPENSSSQSFIDVPVDHPFYEEIEALAATGITTGWPDGTFRPTQTVTRQAMAAFLVRAFDLEIVGGAPAVPSFTDVPTNHHFYAEIEALVATGITTGWPDGTFRPDLPVTRMATAAFLYRTLGLIDPGMTVSTFSDVSTTHPYFKEIEALAASGITTGWPDSTFRPDLAVTRQAMAAFLIRALELEDH